jgi:hypothetical protein
MSGIDAINYLVWLVAIVLLGWMVIDAMRVETTYDRKLLVSSVEGEIEKEILAHHQGHPHEEEA